MSNNTAARNFRPRPVAASIAFALAVGGISPVALAHTASVSTVAQLKAAILTAQTDNLDDVITNTGNITFAAAADAITINVTDGKTLTIQGGGFTINGAHQARIFDVNSSAAGSAVVINNLTITNGKLSGNGGAGALYAGAGNNVLGAGIQNAGNLSITNSTITANKAAGGGGGGHGLANLQAGGGGGGGFGGTNGGNGGGYFSPTLSYPSGEPGSSNTGGSGNFSINRDGPGRGGSTSGGNGGTPLGNALGGSYVSGGNGGTANNGTISIGGGGGGAGIWDGLRYGGGNGGNAAGAIYNTGTLTITGSSITGNIGAGGGGGGGGDHPFNADAAGAGGRGVGGIWNNGGTLNLDASTNTTLSTGNTGGAGSGGSQGPFPPGANGTATNTVISTGGGTQNTNYIPPGIVLTQSASSTDVAEGGATDSYTLVLTSQPNSNVSIGLNPGTQVTVGTSPVVFTNANWNIEQTVTVTAVDDAAVEGPHTGTISHLVVSPDPIYNGVTVGNVVANITDNDLPTLTINDVSITEGNASTQVLNFTVTRTGSTPFAVGFSFATADGSATLADSDYVTTNGIVTIPSGGATASTTVSVTINGDATFENNESFFINLTAPTNAAITDNQGVGTITNDDTAPTLAINDVSIVEGNSGTQNAVFTVTRTGLTALPASFAAATADGTATEPSDYLKAITGSTTIAAGGATGTTTLTVSINGDLTIEPNETFLLDLSAAVNATLADAQGIGTITNDDGEPTFAPAGPITRQQGSPAAIATLGTVSDLTDPANSLAVAIIADTTTGVATTGLTNSNGTVTASLAASCTASAGSFSVRVTDSGGLTDTDTVQINVSPNAAPALAYSAANVSVGNSLTITPSTALSDNGTVTTVSVLSSGTYTGGISVSNSGVISLNNAAPAGNHTLVIRATDNCGANTDVNVALTVGQAGTIKQLSSNVQPSRFGQAVTLRVQVVGVDPTGAVEFFNGAASLGSAPLVASPSGANVKLANLVLSNLAVGSLNLTARYAGDVNNAASVSDVLVQTVLAADTRITLTPAISPAAIGSSTINVLVHASAPGGGVPVGSVTVSAGAASCLAPLTSGAGSCALNFASAGFNTLSASYVPGNANHLTSSGGGALVIVSTPSSTDLRVRIGNGVSNIGAGQALSYLIVVDNIGSQAAVGRLQVPVSADFASASYACISATLANCGTSGTGGIDQELSLAAGGVVIYRLNVTAPLAPERVITQTASITAKTPTTDPVATNNSAADIDPMGLLADGYEDAAVTE